MIDYERIAEEIAENITGLTAEEKEDLYNDENYEIKPIKGGNAGRFRPDLAFIMPCTDDFYNRQ